MKASDLVSHLKAEATYLSGSVKDPEVVVEVMVGRVLVQIPICDVAIRTDSKRIAITLQ